MKKRMLLDVSEICPEKTRMFENITLSHMTVYREELLTLLPS